MAKKKYTHWTQHPDASKVAALEYALVQGFTKDTKENCKVLDDLRNKIDKVIERGGF